MRVITLNFALALGIAALPNAAVAQSTTITAVPNAVPECPAFDIVQKNILTMYGGGAPDADVAAGSAAASVPSEPVATEIIFDASGSMAGQIGGVAKIAVARRALAGALAKLDATDTLVGLRAYGFDTSVAKTPEASCPNTALVSGFGAHTADRHAAVANSLQPYGYTPIADSLLAAAADLAGMKARERIVILITDGEETCNGDPVAAARQLQATGIGISTHVVGFDLDNAQRAQMQAIAQAGGGAYFDAADARALESAIDKAVNITVQKSERVIEKCINHVRGGETLASAVPLLPGLYTLGEFLPKGEERFYRIQLKPGQTAIFRGLLQSQRRIPGDDGQPFETAYALGAVTLRTYDLSGQALGGRAARMRDVPGTTVVRDHVSTTGGGIVLSIGDNYDWVAPDTLFAVDIVGP